MSSDNRGRSPRNPHPNLDLDMNTAIIPDLGPNVDCLWSSAELGASITSQRTVESGAVWAWLSLWLRHGVCFAPSRTHRRNRRVARAKDGSEAKWTVIEFAPVAAGSVNLDGDDDDVCGPSVADVVEAAQELARDLRQRRPINQRAGS
jgi:hypothetical protein